MPELRTRQIIGTSVTISDYDGVLDRFDRAIAERAKIYACCAPASTLVTAHHDHALRDALDHAEVVTPDGMGVVWAARLLGEKIKNRVYGPDLMDLQCRRATENGTRIWLYGGHDEAALEQLHEALVRKHRGLLIAGGWSPPHRPLTDDETAEVASRINSDAPDVVWVGIGSPRQEVWMREMRPLLDAPVLCGVGAAFDFHAGRVPQAPPWMRRVGLEWLYRLLREPRRLGPRYFKTNPAFVWEVAQQVWVDRFRRELT